MTKLETLKDRISQLSEYGERMGKDELIHVLNLVVDAIEETRGSGSDA